MSKRLTIELMQQLALQKGGVCLSRTYKNNQVHLQWKCKNNHTFTSMPMNVKAGKWCPY